MTLFSVDKHRYHAHNHTLKRHMNIAKPLFDQLASQQIWKKPIIIVKIIFSNLHNRTPQTIKPWRDSTTKCKGKKSNFYKRNPCINQRPISGQRFMDSTSNCTLYRSINFFSWLLIKIPFNNHIVNKVLEKRLLKSWDTEADWLEPLVL